MIIIDRFEGKFAVCENGGNRLNIPLALLPADAKEGDIISQKGTVWYAEKEETAKRRAQITAKLKKLGF
jgi:hypothetical protein